MVIRHKVLKRVGLVHAYACMIIFSVVLGIKAWVLGKPGQDSITKLTILPSVWCIYCVS